MVSLSEILINPLLTSAEKTASSISQQIKNLEAQLAAIPKTGPEIQIGTKTIQVFKPDYSSPTRNPRTGLVMTGGSYQPQEVPNFVPSFNIQEASMAEDIKGQINELRERAGFQLEKLQNIDIISIIKANPIIAGAGAVILGAILLK